MKVMTVSKLQMDPSLEIRKLPPRYTGELVRILEPHELWKRLMSIIPKLLEKTNFVCDVTLQNHRKYNSEHFRLIERESEVTKRDCTEILFNEWGTSGRVRPALGHLLYLLTKAKLFRAADYVAVNLLNWEMPERPSTGPEALISLPEVSEERDRQSHEIERSLDKIGYVDSALTLIRTNSAEVGRHQNVPSVIPQIIISPDIEEGNREPQFSLPLVVQKQRIETQDSGGSDMMKFSKSESTPSHSLNETHNRPEISRLLNETSSASDMMAFSSNVTSAGNQSMNNSDNRPVISQLLGEVTESNLPNFDMMNGSVNVSRVENSESTSEEIPAFTELLTSEISHSSFEELPVVEANPSDEPNIPNLSVLNNAVQHSSLPDLSILNMPQESENIPSENSANFMPDFSALKSTTNNIEEASLPNISALGLSSTAASNPTKSISANSSLHLLPTVLNSSHNSLDNSTKSRPCTSPLPNLSLNTLLPHFSYGELENATNNFNAEPYRSTQQNGRFLGSGAFGSVFLALGLLDRPVAVKKLVLGNVEVVNVEDIVTKQFRNEVEVLSKYKHENLLSLLGYSCDGCTYCLMYEYIPGGALKDRLREKQNILQWKERLSIAMGTAKATSYLHTAFSTPLIHRDITSANILLDSKNNPKLCDFGLIKLLPNQNTNTATTVFGTSAYMAPEAFRGDVSVKLDTFSFGVVLLELLTSLPAMDKDRDGTDIVTHIEDKYEKDDITPLLNEDCWHEGVIKFAKDLFKLALECLEEKKFRPNMVEVTGRLEDLLKNVP